MTGEKGTKESLRIRIKERLSFLWRKKYRSIIFWIGVFGVIFIFFSDYFVMMVISIDNITFSEKLTMAIFFLTGLIILWYTRETFDMKNIQNKQIKEVRKDRYLSKMPMIRMLKAGIEPIPKEQIAWAQKERPDLTFKDEDKSFYKVTFKNIGQDWAFIESVTIGLGNTLGVIEEKIKLDNWAFKKTLYSGEEDFIVYRPIRKKGELILYFRFLEIIFKDRYGHKFIYEAKETCKPNAPQSLPLLGISDHIEDRIIYPKELC